VTRSKTGLMALAALCAASLAKAQQPLTLADATTRALSRNHDIRIARDAVEAAGARELSANGSYDLRLHLEGGDHYHRDPITTLFSGAPPGSLSPWNNDITSSASLTQLFRSGATASASASVARDMTNNVFTLFTPAFLTSIGVQARQPLMRGRRADAARTNLTITALDRNRSGAVLTQQIQDTVAAVERAYWALISAQREVTVRQASVMLADQQRVDTQARIDARTAAALDIAQPDAEVARRRGDLLAAQENAVRAERTLKLLMTDDPADPLWSQTITPSDAVDVEARPVDLQRALTDATSHRPELAALAADVSASEAQVALAKENVRPQLDVVAGYTMRGLAGDKNPDVLVFFPGAPTTLPTPLAGDLLTSWRAMGEQRFPDASISVQVDIPLGRRQARGDLGVAQVQQRDASYRLQQMRDRVMVDVLNATTALETAASRIQAARAGLQAATTQLQQEQDRFTAGTSTNFLVLTRQNDLAQARLSEISAATQYRQALTDFARATGMLLADRGITVN
jgi:outer membrane protein TolC